MKKKIIKAAQIIKTYAAVGIQALLIGTTIAVGVVIGMNLALRILLLFN